MRDPKAHWLMRFQSIWKSHCSFKHRVLGWLMLHKGFPIKIVLHKVGVSNVACTLCGRYEIVEYVFLRFPL
jgi:hypothetical protein